MDIRLLTSEKELQHYNQWLQANEQGTLWQSLEWKGFQEALGREVRVYANEKFEASALLVIDRTVGGFSTWEIPRGPLWTSEKSIQELIQTLVADAKKDRCFQLHSSPIRPIPFFILHSPAFAPAGASAGKQFSIRSVHPIATRIIDLTISDAEILAQMHPKGRYNIALARRHGIEVRQGTADDADAFYALLRSTSDRDRFTIARQSHYRHFLTDLGHSFILMAYAQGKPIAGLIGVLWNGTGIYYYGASSYKHRQCMAPYLLQWEAMQYCKAQGCARYDLLGVEKSTMQTFHSNWSGISEFKRKFGGRVITYPPEQTLVLRPTVKELLEWKRRILG